MPADQARGVFADCCGSSKWANGMIARRPFKSRDDVLSATDELFDALEHADWREAFAHHPRIGENSGEKPQGEQGSAWSAREQAGLDSASADVHSQLAAANREYERRFGYIYIVCASGKPADKMLALARERLTNDPEKELKVAAKEQRKITRLRLEKLLDENGEKR